MRRRVGIFHAAQPRLPLPPGNATQPVDQRAVYFGAEAVDGCLASRGDAVDGAGFGDDCPRDGEVAFRGQELRDRRRPFGLPSVRAAIRP